MRSRLSTLFRHRVCSACVSRVFQPHSKISVRRRSTATGRASPPRAPASATIDDYYALLLEQPLPVNASNEAPSASPSPASSATSTSSQPDNLSSVTDPTVKPQTAEEKARIVFGSRLAGPAARAAAEKARTEQKARGEGQWVGSIWVPPRPGEPDNCCMSGCVNCVWDGYREELEEWAGKKKAAFEAADRSQDREAEARSMDHNAASEAPWIETKPQNREEELLEDIPVGIREFMLNEKRLAERKKAHAAT